MPRVPQQVSGEAGNSTQVSRAPEQLCLHQPYLSPCPHLWRSLHCVCMQTGTVKVKPDSTVISNPCKQIMTDYPRASLLEWPQGESGPKRLKAKCCLKPGFIFLPRSNLKSIGKQKDVAAALQRGCCDYLRTVMPGWDSLLCKGETVKALVMVLFFAKLSGGPSRDLGAVCRGWSSAQGLHDGLLRGEGIISLHQRYGKELYCKAVKMPHSRV